MQFIAFLLAIGQVAAVRFASPIRLTLRQPLKANEIIHGYNVQLKMQGDCNLVLSKYKAATETVIWASHTANEGKLSIMNGDIKVKEWDASNKKGINANSLDIENGALTLRNRKKNGVSIVINTIATWTPVTGDMLIK